MLARFAPRVSLGGTQSRLATSHRFRSPRTAPVATAIFVTLAATACRAASDPTVVETDFRGSYASTADAGAEVRLDIERAANVWIGSGTFAGRSVLFVGRPFPRVVGNLLFDGGASVDVSLDYTRQDEPALEMGDQRWTLARVADAPELVTSGGPFAGRWVPLSDGSWLTSLELIQSGDTLAGTAILLGRRAQVAAWRMEPDVFGGRVIFSDGGAFVVRGRRTAEGRLSVDCGGQTCEMEVRP